MRWIVFLPFCLALVSAGISPHADLVKQLAESPEGARYSNNVLEDAYLDVPDLITKYGYPVEVHNVITSDGYMLEMHRIPYGKNNKQKDRIPVFLMHGLLASSADFVVLGPENALAYYLTDQGYDVWLGNARGNYYSRRHRRLSPNNPLNTQFWQFSWDEIGYYDLPAFLDRIVSTTGQKVHFIGHSQGGTSFVVMASLRPEYNSKLLSFQGLAPAVFFVYNNFTLINTLAPYEKPIEAAYFASLTGELLPRMKITTHATVAFCSDDSPFQELCHSLPLIGAQVTEFNTTMIPLFIGHTPAGASIRQLAHYAQSINSNRFRRFDYGTLTNLLKYGRRNPPEYDLSKITTPTYLHYSLNDKYVHYKDVDILEYRLGNCVGKYLIGRESFLHVDFIWGRDVREQLYDTLKYTLRHAEGNL